MAARGLQDFFLITRLAVIENLMRTFPLYEVEAFLRSSRAEDGETHGARHLHRRAADSAACAVHQHAFGSMRFRGMIERMIRGPVGNPDACALAETDFFGQAMHLLFQRESVLRVSASDGLRRVDAVARLHFFHFVADHRNDACAIRAGRVGKRWFDGIRARAHVGVVGIHACGMDAYKNLSGGGLWGGHFFEPENFRTTEFANENGFHVGSPSWSDTENLMFGELLNCTPGKVRRYI